MSTALATALATQVAIVNRGQKTFVAVGEAMATIRDNKLYRETILPGGTKPCSFEAFCKFTWGFSRARAYQLIGTTKVIENVYNCRQENQPDVPSEGVSRELGRAPKSEQAAVLKEAAELTPTGKPTAKQVKKIVDDRKAAESPEPPKDQLGQVIQHKHVADAFARAGELNQFKNKVHALARALDAIDPQIGAHLDRQGTASHMQSVAANIRFGVPYAICPYCKGKKCENCRHVGWLPKEKYGNVPGSVKK